MVGSVVTNDLMVFTGNANPGLAARIAKHLTLPLSKIQVGRFSDGDRELFKPIIDTLLDPHDPYLLLKDLESYLACQGEVERVYRDQQEWTRRAILNVARMGKFSSDRTIREYARDIWGVKVE